MTGAVIPNKRRNSELTRLLSIGDIKSVEHAQTLLDNWSELYLSGTSYRIMQVERSPLSSIILYAEDAFGVTSKYDLHDYRDYRQSIYLYGYRRTKIVDMFDATT